MLQIVSQNECKYLNMEQNFNLIRVEDDLSKLIQIPLKSKKELDLIFNDISLSVVSNKDIVLPDNWIIFNQQMAHELLSFFQEINNEDLIIHCYAGFSRSSAIGLAYAWYKEDKTLEQSILNSHYTPNTQVLYEMAKAMNLLQEKEYIINYYKQYK